MMNFAETLKAIDYFHHNTDIVPFLMGHTGIGKTDLVKQYALLKGYVLIIIHVAHLEPSDFVGLYKTTEDGRTMNCPPNWLPYIKNIKDTKKVEVIEVDQPKGYVVFLDEANRAKEDMRQSMQQYILTKKIHTYESPANTYLVAAGNPSNKYETYDFDDALVNKFANIKFRPDVQESLDYLEHKHGGNPFHSWLSSDKDLLDLGDDDFEISGLKLTPRIADNAMRLYEPMANEPLPFVRKMYEAIMPKEKVASLLAFLEEIKHINYVDVLNGVKKEKVTELLKNNRRDVLSTIVHDLGKLYKEYELGTSDVKQEVKGIKVSDKEARENCAAFLEACPSELATTFLNTLQEKYNQKTCVLKDESFNKALSSKLKGFKDVIKASKTK